MAVEMKNSGVQWIGKIPIGWSISKMQYIADYYNGFAFKPSDWSETGLQIIRIQDLTGSNDNPNYYEGQLLDRYKVRKGDVLISWAATLNSFIWEREDAWLNQHIFKTKHYENIVTKEFFYWLTQVVMQNMNNANKHGIMMQHVTTNVFNKFPLPLPPLSEQKAIANFLDEKCAEIDGLLADLEEQIKTLRAYEKSLIAETVTHGLNPNAQMKQSGIPWAETIPTHWNVVANKYLMHKQKDIVPVYAGQDIISLSMQGVIVRDLDAGGKMPTSFNGYQQIYPGNLLMCLFDIDVTPRCIGLIKNKGLTSPAYSQFVMKDGAYAPYYYYFYLKMDNSKELVYLSKNMRHSINEEQFGMIKTIQPPYEEQIAIANYLDDKIARIEDLIGDKFLQTLHLKEYKSSLIYEYVTGKKQLAL